MNAPAERHGPDPVGLAAGRFCRWSAGFDTAEAAMRDVLEHLHANGWRLVRTDPCNDPNAAIGECGCQDTRITEEWTP